MNGCNSSYPEKNISFHWFPKANISKVEFVDNNGLVKCIDKRLAWAMRFKMGKLTHEKNIRICSKHFSDDDFYPNPPGIIIINLHFSGIIINLIFLGLKTLRRKLKKNAIPSIYLNPINFAVKGILSNLIN